MSRAKKEQYNFMIGEYRSGNFRIQFLTKDIVRIEYANDGKFCDEETFFVPARSFEGGVEFTAADVRGGVRLVFGGYELFLPHGGRGMSGIVLSQEGKAVYRCRELSNTGELPSLGKTPEVFAVSDNPRIRVPAGGYTYRGEIENSGYVIEKDVSDVYLLLCGRDAKKLRRLYVQLTGRCLLVRLSVLGAWNSKYYKYSEESAKQVICDYETYGIPLDNMVIDTDWRAASDRGIGYDIDTKLFPDMRRFFGFAHSHGVEIMFNDHPEPVDGAKDLLDPKEVRFREEKLQGLLSLGLDTWWYDRNWHTALISPVSEIYPETFGLYLFEDITRHYYQKAVGGGACRRPVVMGNVNNIWNGNYEAIHDSASHRFGIQWTGDIMSDPISLASEVKTLIRASDNGIIYVNSDCGGHIGDPDKELYLRWIQFGVFSPVFRPHCTNDVKRFREPWLYDEEALDIARAFIKMRYRLLPVLYANAFNSYLSGEPLFRGLGWEYPADKKALACDTEYMLGKDILVAPVAGERMQKPKQACYTAPVKAVFFDGTELAGEPIAEATYKTLDLELDNVPPTEGVPVYHFSARFETRVKFEKDTELFLLCDDGATVYVDGRQVFRDDKTHPARLSPLCTVEGGREHSLTVEYFQAGGAAYCVLYYDAHEESKKSVYLPEGKWMDVFGGKVYLGGRSYARCYAIGEMPLFVRLGALLPLAHDAKNTKQQTWDRLTFDYYPDREARDEGFLYEDDTETTAYEHGEYRTTPYEAFYDGETNAYVVRLGEAQGSFRGAKAFPEREITVRLHLATCGGTVQNVTVNGADAKYRKLGRDAGAFPFAAEGGTRDGESIAVTFRVGTDQRCEVRFCLTA